MTIRSIFTLPHPILETPAKPVTLFNSELQTTIDDMFETMYAAKGIGLAAPQIGLSLRLAVIDVTEERNNLFVLINPEMIWSKGEAMMEEGCLSIPGVYGRISRALMVKLKWMDREGNFHEIEAEGLLAHCIQHELDHLDGKLFIRYQSLLKQNIALKKVQKIKRQITYSEKP